MANDLGKENVMPRDQFPITEGYDDFLRDLKERIRRAQVQAVLAINRELVLLYWQIGRDILTRQQQLSLGSKGNRAVSKRLAEGIPRYERVLFPQP